MIVVGLSGAQGAGKSTLLKALMDKGWLVDQFRVSRAVQADLGWESLDRVMDSPETMFKFQEMVLEQKYKNDHALSKNDSSSDIILTERTFADVLAYTLQWSLRFIKSNKLDSTTALDRLKPFIHSCQEYHNACYDGTIMLPYMEHVSWDIDPHRAAKEDARTVFSDIQDFMSYAVPEHYPRLMITGKTVEERVQEVELFLESI